MAEEKMHLLRDASRGRSVRDRANKIVEQQERINGIKSKIAALVQAEESVQTPIVAATLGPLPSNSDIGTSVVIHREILGLALPITSSGSQETPMAVDSEGNKNDRISNSGYVVLSLQLSSG